MLGFRFFQFQPIEYVLYYKGGRLYKEGAGLSFFAFLPDTTLQVVPMGSLEAPFFVEEATGDFQVVAVQGQLVFQIVDPRSTSRLLNYTVDPVTRAYVSEDPEKLGQRVVNLVRVELKRYLEKLGLDAAVQSSETLAVAVVEAIMGNNEVKAMGLEILGLSILSLKPTKETSRALEAHKREAIMKIADVAIYERRNASIEQERGVKENELNTEIAIENKKREIRETQIDAEQALQAKEHELRQAELEYAIDLEEKRSRLIELSVANARAQADVRAYELSAMIKALEGVSPQVIQILAGTGMEPAQLIAQAFQSLAENSGKIGQLNISPDLLQQLIREV